MKILGIHDGHNASIAYLDEEGLFALQEERLAREKNIGGFPKKALDYLFNEYRPSLKVSDIDRVALAGNAGTNYSPTNITTRDQSLQGYENQRSVIRKLKDLLRKTPIKSVYDWDRRKKKIANLLKYGFTDEQIEYVDHHRCHVMAGLSSSDFDFGFSEPVLVFTSDGGGDGNAATVQLWDGSELNRVSEIPDDNSLGNVYSAVTFLLGFVPGEHEYKIMGLEPYVRPDKYEELKQKFESILFFEEDNLIWSRGKEFPPTQSLVPKLEKMILRNSFDKVSGALQKFTEDLLTTWIRRNCEHYDVHNVVVGGGVFMNVKANQKIMELDCVDQMFVMPSCGDDTNSIGALAAIHEDSIPALDINNLYLGPEFNEDIEKVLEDNKGWLKFERFDNIESEVAELLAEGKIIARYKGRLEFGARALGHRSILAHPGKEDVVPKINDFIKKRDFWMPFAGSFIEEKKDMYYKDTEKIDAYYMNITFDSVLEERENIEAALHNGDKTGRPQFVTPDTDADYHHLISEFGKRTGIYGVLNTSFNLHGLPIVAQPEDALKVLRETKLKYLALGDYLVQKKEG